MALWDTVPWGNTQESPVDLISAAGRGHPPQRDTVIRSREQLNDRKLYAGAFRRTSIEQPRCCL
jgi:hypothetical protein